MAIFIMLEKMSLTQIYKSRREIKEKKRKRIEINRKKKWDPYFENKS